MITCRSGKPSEGMSLAFHSEAEAVALALSLERKTDRNGEISFHPRTPPVENSKAVGGPSAADGQGVCTCDVPCQMLLDGLPCVFPGNVRADDKFPRFQLDMSWPDGYEGYPTTMECQGWREVGLYISRCLDDGATVCSVVLK